MARRTAEFHLSFIQKLIRELRTLEILPQKILVAASGGVDSVALVLALKEVQKLFHLELVVGHVHHGVTGNQEVDQYRREAQIRVRDLAHRQGIHFVTNEAQPHSFSSEAELRDFRYGHLKQWQKEHGLQAVALAHHFEDLLETQMMRLFRGTSEKGLQAMLLLSPQGRLRPFLNFHKEELQKFVTEKNESWVEDPSNQELLPLRNKVRHWLKDIEQSCPGATENLAKSLQRIARQAMERENPWKQGALTNGGISRSVFMSLARPLKAELLAEYLRGQEVSISTSGQIFELIKRLDVSRKEARFIYLGCHWALEPEMIKMKKVLF